MKQMDPEIIRKLIEKESDHLSDKIKQFQKLKQNAICPSCGSPNLEFRINMDNPFTSEGMPRLTAECIECGHVFDIESGLSLC